MKCSLGISNFLEEICSLSHSVVFLHFFALIAKECFLISPCYSLEFCIQMGYRSFFPLPFTSLFFIAVCKASSDNHFAFLHFFFLRMILITASCTMSWTSVHSSSGTLSNRSNPLNLFVTSLVAQRLKHLPAMRETWVQTLGWEYPPEKEMATHSSIPAWRIPWTEEPSGL